MNVEIAKEGAVQTSHLVCLDLSVFHHLFADATTPASSSESEESKTA